MGGIIPKELSLKFPKILNVSVNIPENDEYGKALAKRMEKENTEEKISIINVNDNGDIDIETKPVSQVQENIKQPASSPFTINDYVFENDGTVRLRNSSVDDVEKQSVTGTGLSNIIINDPTIKELIPEIKADDIYIQSYMLLMKVNRGNDEEIYRLDILNNIIYVQAPFESPYHDISTNIDYGFISVPINTELGRKILSTKDYKIKSTDCKNIEINNSIFRETQDAA